MEPMLKSQTVRLLDVALIGPLMIVGGWELRERQPLVGWPLAFFGLTTMLYNSYNHAQYARLQAGG